jgi:hypothetical protein
METYENLIGYISYFENEENKFFSFQSPETLKDGSFSFGYYNYAEEFLAFIKEFYDSDLTHTEYLDYLYENVPDRDYVNVIPEADKQLLSALFTFYVRANRFSEGSWAASIEDKVFLKILKRLGELV